MALGAGPLGTNPLACFIYIWPSRELIAQSWHWPASWHEAFEHAAGLLGLAAAMQVLDGRSFDQEQFELPLCACCVRFSVTRRGESIMIAISDFTGPDTPDPDGGARQPNPVDGLVLGLRGSGRYFRLVVFHGFMPPIPKINEFLIQDSESIIPTAGEMSISTGRDHIILPIEIAQISARLSGHYDAPISAKSPISQNGTAGVETVFVRLCRLMPAHAPVVAKPPGQWASGFAGENADEIASAELHGLLYRSLRFWTYPRYPKWGTSHYLQIPESSSASIQCRYLR